VEPIHLLIVNPRDAVLRLVKAGHLSKAQGPMKFTIVLTKDVKTMLGETYFNAKVVDLKSEEWDPSIKYVSAFAYDYIGQQFLNDISDQILLQNGKDLATARMANYYRSQPPIGCKLVETISYMGRHVVVSCLNFVDDKKISMHTTFDDDYANLIENVFENLDKLEIINGATQTYIDSAGIAGIRMHPSNLTYQHQKLGTSRHWFDVWPGVTMNCGAKSNNKSFRGFYEWAENTGTSSKFYTAKPLTI
jgi:hypothetical protein